MMDERITNIECKLAHQEMTVDTLNEVVTRQQQEITLLRQQLSVLQAKITDILQQQNDPQTLQKEPPPPHY